MSRRALLGGISALGVVGVGCATSPSRSRDQAVPGERHDYGDAPEQFGLLAPLADRKPLDAVVVLIHGGFWSEPWDYTLMAPMAAALNELGYITWNIEFRRVGGGGGFPTTFDDVTRAIEYLAVLAEIHGFGLDRIMVVGHSSGGHLALWAAAAGRTAVPVANVVGVAAVTDLARTAEARHLLGGTIEQLPERYEYAQPVFDRSRMFLVHGSLDGIVPIASLARAEEAGIAPTVIAGANHFDVIDPKSAAWPAVVDVLESVARNVTSRGLEANSAG